MAKSRRNRGGPAHRRDPIAKQVKPPSDPELAALREAKILPVVKDLRSADPKARSAAAAAVTNIIHDARCRKLLLREQVVHTLLTQTLTDAALESRAAGWGILQVLAQEEEADFCVHLFRQDVLTAMEHAAAALLDRLHSKQPAFSALPQAEQAFATSIAASLVSLSTALAEAGDDVFQAVSHSLTLERLLVFLVAHQGQGQGDRIAALRTDALACLMMLCEDNGQLASNIAQSDGNPCFEALMLLKKEVNCDGILACAALHNIFAALASSQPTTLPPLLDDDSTLISTLAKVISKPPPPQPVTNDGGWSNPHEQYQLALETLASIGTSLNNSAMGAPEPQREPKSEARDDEDMGDADEPDSDGAEDAGEDGDGDADEDEMGEDEMMADMEMVAGADDADADADAGLDDLPVLKALVQTALPHLVRLARAEPEDEGGARLRSLALSALNNVAWSVSVVDFDDSHNAGIQRAWAPVGRSLWEQVISPVLSTDTADVELAAQVTGLAWAVARALGGRVPLAPGEHRRFISLYQATRGLPVAAPGDAGDDPFQSLGVKCVGVLGRLALDPAPAERNRDIGAFLVALVAALPDTPPAEAVEALDQLFDVYGDEAHACDRLVFWPDGLLARLEGALPGARAAARAVDRKSSPELRARADEAVLNLGRFIAYKKKKKQQQQQQQQQQD
ncbi:hypothetical protein CDD83_9122 [Cordyceps sp. RAO-2017]|nr:hypothetical protein CDD83_9122 [Cordyceps sp. RAO-2017]